MGNTSFILGWQMEAGFTINELSLLFSESIAQDKEAVNEDGLN